MASVGGIRLLVVSNSAATRGLWEQAAAGIPGVAALVTAASPSLGLAKVRPVGTDLVVLDLAGATTDLREARAAYDAAYPGIQFLLTGGAAAAASREVIAALRQGVLDFIDTPATELPDGERVRELRGRLVPLVGLCLSRRFARGAAGDTAARGPARIAPGPKRLRTPGGTLPRVEIVLVAVSTGGPEALSQVLPRLPGDLGVPVLVVQHMPETLADALARDLAARGNLPVWVAAPGDEVLPNRIYLAPGGRHLLVERVPGVPGCAARRQLACSDAPPENSVRPAADVLFRSAAAAYDGTVLAVVLTGMGADGLAGLRALKAGHCYCITQTAATCAVYGMPRSVDEAGLADEHAPLSGVSDRIASLVAGRG